MKKDDKEVKTKKGKSSLSDTIKEIRRKFGDEAIMMLEDKPHVDVDALPSGSLGLDWALGIGGYPRGRIIEVFGPESSGKTTMALTAIAEAQMRGWACAFIDAEHSMDPIYARNLRVDTSKLLISQPGSGEEALSIVDALVQGGQVGLIVVDSVAALTPRAIIEGEVGEIKVGALARLMSSTLGKLTGSVAKSKTIVLFTNQLRMTMMTFGGANPETTSGGKALKFYASVRLDVRKIATLKKGDEPVGSKVRVKVVKNKVAAPFKQTEVDVLFNEGISREAELLFLGEKYGVISNYQFGDHKLGRGYESARQFLKENEAIAAEIRREITSEMLK